MLAIEKYLDASKAESLFGGRPASSCIVLLGRVLAPRFYLVVAHADAEGFVWGEPYRHDGLIASLVEPTYSVAEQESAGN